MSGRTQKQLLQVGCHALVPGIKPAYGYVPSFAAGIVFCILFGLSFFGHVFRGVTKRRWTSYVLAAGAVTEIIGWAGRTASAKCPYSQNDFLMQITTLIIAPCFMSAAAYITLGALIRIVGRQSSLLSPRMYVIIFSSFDVISLVVQAIGGGSASVANQRGTSTKVGTDIMVAGILFQLATMIVFCCFLLDFVRRARGMEKPGSTRVVIYAMAFSILTIFIRSIYRSIELLQGWTGFLITHERYFIALDGAMMILAVGVYNFIDPATLLPKVHAKDAMTDQDTTYEDVSLEAREVKSGEQSRLPSKRSERSV